ncbi:extracellular solute-binding protein [Paenibacillus harenae]|uniref:extracellular solute-binding protein n=1 Tax=Paenibacillus harenae TaxID=306543 RepID=UPI00040B0A40|nr:extracellular solute-binding protein [Paenibacillus harenae]
MKRKKAWTTGIAVAIATTTLLAGCSTNNTNSTGNTNTTDNQGVDATAKPEGKNEKPTAFSLMTINYLPEEPKADHAIWQEIEKQTNTDVDLTFVPSNNYGEKFQVTLASGEIPDVILTTFIYDPTVLNAIKNGAFWDLTPYIDQYPNLKNNYPKESFENTKVDGKIYGLPRPRPLVGGVAFPALRKDWLDNLGLQEPQTMDELYNVLKAFTEQDPDGNKKNDTFGFAGSVAEGWMDRLAFVEDVFAGYQNSWTPINGKVESRDLQPSTRESLLWLRRAYEEGVLMPDFAILKATQLNEFMQQGKVGMVPTAMDAINMGDATTTLRKTVPNADIVHLPYLVSPATNEKFAAKEGGFFGNYLISKKVPEEKLKEILEFFNYGASPEGMELANFGIKDVHFTEADGVKTKTEEFNTSGADAYRNIFTLVDSYSRINPTPNSPADYFEKNKKIIEQRLEHGVFINTNGVTSETGLTFESEILKKLTDMKVKVIMGKEPIEAWDKLVEQTKNDATMLKIQEEKTASYNKLFGR